MTTDNWTPTGDNWLKSSEAATLSGLSVRKIEKLAYKALSDGEQRYDDVFLKHPKYPNIYVHKINFFAKYNIEANTKIDLEFKAACEKALDKIYSNNISYLIEDLKIITEIPLRTIRIHIKNYKLYGEKNIRQILINSIENIFSNPEKYSFSYLLKNGYITVPIANGLKKKNKTYAYILCKRMKKNDSALADKMFKKIGSRILVNRELWEKLNNHFVSSHFQMQFEKLYFEVLEIIKSEKKLLSLVRILCPREYQNIYNKIKSNFIFGTEITTLNAISILKNIIKNKDIYIYEQENWLTTKEASVLKEKERHYAIGAFAYLKKNDSALADKMFKKIGSRILVNRELWKKWNWNKNAKKFNEDWLTTKEASCVKNACRHYAYSVYYRLSKNDSALADKMFKKIDSRILVNRELWEKYKPP